MSSALDKKFAKFLREQRGEMTFAQFAKKLGMTPSSVFRLERCEQSITLGKLQQVIDRLKCSLDDMFN